MASAGQGQLRGSAPQAQDGRRNWRTFPPPISEASIQTYIGPTADDQAFRCGLDLHDIPHERLRPRELPDLRPGVVDAHTLVGVGERVFSSRQIVEILAGKCLAAGVSILVGMTVSRITRDRKRVTGVMVGVVEHLPTRHVVIAASLGTTQLLTDAGSRLPKQLRSRLDMMIYFPRAELRRGLVFTELHRPVLIPAPGGVLASFFGGVQPRIEGRRAFGVDIAKAATLSREIEQTLHPRSVNREDAVASSVPHLEPWRSRWVTDSITSPPSLLEHDYRSSSDLDISSSLIICSISGTPST